MSVSSAAIVLAWIAIAFLAIALAACARALRFQEAKLAQVIAQPKRLSPGDRLRLPRSVEAHAEATDDVLLVFVKRDCRSCTTALRQLEERRKKHAANLRLVVMWRGARPPDAELSRDDATVHLDHQARAFEELKIGLLPTGVFLRRGRVVAAGAIGSRSAVDDLWTAVEEHLVEGDVGVRSRTVSSRMEDV